MIFLQIILFIILFFLIRGIIIRIYYLNKFGRSFDKLDEIGLINTVSGKIGAGKSILCSCFTQLLTLKIIFNLEETMYEIERILIEVDFLRLENLIKKHNLSIDNLEDQFNFLLSEYTLFDDNFNSKKINKLDKIYFDFINKQDRSKLLKRWIECYLHLHRNSYVFANIRVFNHITSSYSYPFENEWIHLKITEDFPLIKYSIFFEDDKTLYSNNLQFMKKLHEDTGSDTFMRLFRHLFEEKSYYIVSLQDVDRWIKHEREISTNHIFVKKSVIVGEFKFLNTLINFIDKSFNLIYWLLKKFYKNERYYNKPNFFKRLFYKLDLFRKYLFSKTYLKVDINVHDDIDNVGKEIKENDYSSYSYSFIAPIYYFFGNLNSHEFNEVYKYMYDKSSKKYSDLNEFLFDKEKVLEVLGDIKTPEDYDKKNIF